MKEQPTLTDAEWTLIIELLERELRELPAEIHHTRTPVFRDELYHRRDMLQRLLERLRQAG